MDDERTPVKAKKFVVERSENGRPKKRWKEVEEKEMLVREFKRTDALDRFFIEDWLQKSAHPVDEENKPGSRRMKRCVRTPGTNG